MINNKQVNLWRGDNPPPTIYHVWIYKESKILLYDGTDWVIFVNDKDTVDKITALQKQVDKIQINLDDVIDSTINNKKIIENPVLSGQDLLLNKNGYFVTPEQTISDSVVTLDSKLYTLIIE